jgi:hypothetical protein
VGCRRCRIDSRVSPRGKVNNVGLTSGEDSREREGWVGLRGRTGVARGMRNLLSFSKPVVAGSVNRIRIERDLYMTVVQPKIEWNSDSSAVIGLESRVLPRGIAQALSLC